MKHRGEALVEYAFLVLVVGGIVAIGATVILDQIAWWNAEMIRVIGQ